MKRKFAVIAFMLIMVISIVAGCTLYSGGVGQDGQDGADGRSAFEIWLAAGNEGSEEDFLEWLRGSVGQSGQDGQNGMSAFEIWLSQSGNYGKSEADFLEWLLRPPVEVQNFMITFYRVNIDAVTASKGTLIWQPSNPISGEHEFLGWYLDRSFENRANFPFMLSENIVLFARWDFVADYGLFYGVRFGVETFINGLSETGRQQSKIVIPASVTHIGYNAFRDEESIRYVYFERGSRLRTLPVSAFRGTNLIEIELPASLTNINANAFLNVTTLERVTFERESQLEFIGPQVFLGAVNLLSIIIPVSVKHIGHHAFAHWTSDQSIYFKERLFASNEWDSDWFQLSSARLIWGGLSFKSDVVNCGAMCEISM